MNSNSSFAKLLHEYGGIEEESVEEDNDKSSSNTITDENPQLSTEAEVIPKAAAVTSNTIAPGRTPGLMTTEERSTGAVNGKIYMVYFSAGGGLVGLTMIMALLILTQVTRVGNDLWLSYWSEQKWGLTKEIYISGCTAGGTIGPPLWMMI
ncbi:hypothetical protein K7432_013884 [Basidiobolus ranarum]|uniref:Uncharacterized protein n=1 Tax=Basidiobolus ranarum TaxID=34480 RepID=A0ABR2WIN5_9FUNG